MKKATGHVIDGQTRPSTDATTRGRRTGGSSTQRLSRSKVRYDVSRAMSHSPECRSCELSHWTLLPRDYKHQTGKVRRGLAFPSMRRGNGLRSGIPRRGVCACGANRAPGPFSAAKSRGIPMQPRFPLLPVRAVLLAIAVLAVGACADRTARSGAGNDIVWDTESAAPSDAVPVSPSAAPVPPGGSARIDPCREYTQTVMIGGKEEKAFGRVCPQPDGSWRFEPPQTSLPRAEVPAASPWPAPVYAYPPTRSMFFFGSAFSFSDRHHRHRHRHHPRHRHTPRFR